MAKIVRPYLRDILEVIDKIDGALEGKTFADYSDSWLLMRSVERGVEIISEASRGILAELRATQPSIPWQKILGIGNVLRHDYRRVADRVLYAVATTELASLKAAILAIEAALDEPEDE